MSTKNPAAVSAPGANVLDRISTLQRLRRIDKSKQKNNFGAVDGAALGASSPSPDIDYGQMSSGS
jgi:hypothetical protein